MSRNPLRDTGFLSETPSGVQAVCMLVQAPGQPPYFLPSMRRRAVKARPCIPVKVR
jgi:hypothetical protein